MLSIVAVRYRGLKWYISAVMFEVLDGILSVLIGTLDLCKGGRGSLFLDQDSKVERRAGSSSTFTSSPKISTSLREA